MFLSLLLAATLQSSELVDAPCLISAHGATRENPIPTSLTVDCPEDVVDAEQLQRVADQAIASISLDFDRGTNLQIIGGVWFEWTQETNWHAAIGERVIIAVPRLETRITESGHTRLGCSYAAWPDERGVPTDVETSCFLDGSGRGSLVRLTDRAVREAIDNTRFLPTRQAYCFQDEIRTTMGIGLTGGRTIEEPDLPMLCAS